MMTVIVPGLDNAQRVTHLLLQLATPFSVQPSATTSLVWHFNVDQAAVVEIEALFTNVLRVNEPPAAEEPCFTCPRCDRTSHHPADIANGYCGACRDYTGRDIAVGPSTDAMGTPIGDQMLVNVHAPSACEGRGCVIHHPSDHHMVTWRTLWREDRGLMERICPDHGVGHPDPDDLAYQASIGRQDVGLHGCCGCCVSPDPHK